MRGVRRRPLTSTGATDFDAFTRADPPQPSGLGAACTVPANPTDNTPAATAAATTFFTRNSFNQWSPAEPLPAADALRVRVDRSIACGRSHRVPQHLEAPAQMNPARDGENQERPDRRHNVAVGVLSSRTRIRCARRTGVLPGRGRWCRRRNPLRRAASEGEPQRRAILVGPTARFRASSGQSPPLSGAAPLEQLPTFGALIAV